MLSEQTRQALVDIAHNAALAEPFVGGLDAEAFAADLKTVYATTRCLEIISEAVRRAGPELRDRHAHLPWRQMMSAGNISPVPSLKAAAAGRRRPASSPIGRCARHPAPKFRASSRGASRRVAAPATRRAAWAGRPGGTAVPSRRR